MQLRFGLIRAEFDRARAIAIALITVIFTFTGPFGTFGDLNLIERLVYWALADIGVAVFMSVSGHTLFDGAIAPAMARPLKALIAAMAGAIPGAFVIMAVEYAIRGNIHNLFGLFYLWLCVTFIGVLMMAVRFRLWQPPPQRLSPFLKRLPPELGTGLISLSMADHYLQVRTTSGSGMLHMRFTDALAELKTYPGQRIHRSHWVAHEAMKTLQRDRGRYWLTLADGGRLPVSISYLDEVRKTLKPGLHRPLRTMRPETPATRH